MLTRVFAILVVCLASLMPTHGLQVAEDGVTLVICTPQGLSEITLSDGQDPAGTGDPTQEVRHCPGCTPLATGTPAAPFVLRRSQGSTPVALTTPVQNRQPADAYRRRPRGPPSLV